MLAEVLKLGGLSTYYSEHLRKLLKYVSLHIVYCTFANHN